MQKRLFSHDAATGITKWFHYDDATDSFTLETQQDTTKLAERAQRLRNEQSSLERWGDGKVVASVPLSIYMEWVKQGKEKDQAFVRRWLNDPENRIYRTFQGRV